MNKGLKKRSTIRVRFLLIMTVLTLYGCSFPTTFNSLVLNENTFTITGRHGGEWHYEDVTNTELVDEMPDIRGRYFGRSNSQVSQGHYTFHDEQYERGLLFIHKNSPLYIVIELEDDKPIFINAQTSEETNSWFEGLNQYIDEDLNL